MKNLGYTQAFTHCEFTMRSTPFILITCIIILLSACGQKGPLYFPGKPPQKQRVIR